MQIEINLRNIQTTEFEDNEFLHQEAKNKFLEVIKNHLNLIKEKPDERVHNTILINGKRGYGKTSFMLTMIKLLKQNYFKELFILDIIDPTIVETKENIFILVLTIIKKEVEKHFNNPCGNILENYKREFENSLRKLASGLSVLDGVGENSIFKESIWNESELILEDALKNTKGGSELEKNFKEFMDVSLKILNKEAFILFFDDIDTAANQGEMILELIRKYFTSKKLFVVILGDIELFSLIVRNMQWKKLSPIQIQKYENNLIDSLYSKEIDTLTQQYLIKIIPIENIINLKKVYDLANMIYVEGIKLKEFIKENIVKTLFYEHNKAKILVIEEFLINLPLRSLIQILSNKKSIMVLNYIFFNNLKPDDTKNLYQVFNSFNYNQNDKYYLLYKYVKNLNYKENDYTFLTQGAESSKNNLNILLNAHIAQSINSIQDILDYFIKFYMPLEFGCGYDNNTHALKISRYFVKDLRKNNLQSKIFSGTIYITNDEFKKLNLNEREQAIFNIFTVGLFTNSGLKNYFSFWNLFGFISDIFFYGLDINLDKLLQIKSYHIDNVQNMIEVEQKSLIQEAIYDTTELGGWCVSTKVRDELFPDNKIKISARQLSSIWTRVIYSIKYIDDNPSFSLSEQFSRYLQAIQNAFIIVVLENEKGIKFNNALSLGSQIFKDNLEILKKNEDKYLWLSYFIELKIWNLLKQFASRLEHITLVFDFYTELEAIEFEGNLKNIKENILKKSEELYIVDISKLISAIKGRKSLDPKISARLIRELEKIKDKSKIKVKK